MTAWTATADRMPDDEQTVLIVTADGEVWTGYHDDDTWFDVSCYPVGVVTHWMDFPEAPSVKVSGPEGGLPPKGRARP